MNASGHSALLTGAVMHQRLVPFSHGFRYRHFMLRLDLDEMPTLGASLRLFGIDRRRPVAVHASDHLSGDGSPLRPAIAGVLRAHGVSEAPARVVLLTGPRVFGYVFNPVSFWLCYRHDASLLAVVAEVNNTFGERHCYVLPADGRGASPAAWQDKKVFHVSPFFSLDGTYRFELSLADAHTDIRIDLHRDGAPVFVSRLALEAQPLTDRALAGWLLRAPLSAVKVIVAIHWEALRLWLKGATYHPKPTYDPAAARTTRG